jgi:hypothetical protein
MSKQTYTGAKQDVINFVLMPYHLKCSKCHEVRYCNPDDYRIESGEFCTPEDYIKCPLVNIMRETMALADEMEYLDTYEGQELLGHWKRKNTPYLL